MPECPREFTPVGGAEGVTVVLDTPEIVTPDNSQNLIDVGRIAQCVRHEDGLRLLRDGPSGQFRVNIVRAELHVNEDRYELVLYYRVEGRRETARGGDHLVARSQAAFPQEGRCQGGDCQQICRGA